MTGSTGREPMGRQFRLWSPCSSWRTCWHPCLSTTWSGGQSQFGSTGPALKLFKGTEKKRLTTLWLKRFILLYSIVNYVVERDGVLENGTPRERRLRWG